MKRLTLLWVVFLFLFVGCDRFSEDSPTSDPNPRVVADSERGLFYSYPAHDDYENIGALLTFPNNSNCEAMPPRSICVPMGKIQHWAPRDRFPLDDFKNFESTEIAAGRDPMLVTAGGLPVYFSYSDISGNSASEIPENELQQAVNLADDRYITYWIDNYLKTIMYEPGSLCSPLWIGIENFTIDYDRYYVIENGVFQPAGVWDEPFPQNEEEWFQSFIYFFQRARQLEPEIRFATNGFGNSFRFEELYRYIDFSATEEIFRNRDIFAGQNVDYHKKMLLMYLDNYIWFNDQGGISLFQSRFPSSPSDEELRRTYLMYLMFRGPNSFFAPRYDGTTNEVEPELFSEIQDDLGKPVKPTITTLAEDAELPAEEGRVLYKRECEGGIAYINFTGQDITVELPSGNWYDRNGAAVTQLFIPELYGDYVKKSP